MNSYVGCHLSTTGGYAATVKTATSIGANTFAFFTRNPRGSKAKAEDPADTAAAMALLRESAFGPLVAHGAYTMNVCTADKEARAFATGVLEDDLRRMAALPGNYYNFHPGCHVGQGTETGISQICDALRKALAPGYPVTVLLETMAGKGSEIGGKFEELKAIIDAVGSDRVVGLDRLYALHLNDSKNPFASHKDRHELLGQGNLGMKTFENIVNCEALRGKPMILETPNDLPGYAAEIEALRKLQK